MTGIKVHNDEDAIKALDTILGLGVKIAIISSAVLPGSKALYSYVSREIGKWEGISKTFLVFLKLRFLKHF